MTNLRDTNRGLLSVLLRIAVACCFISHGYLAFKAGSVYFSAWSNWIQGLVALVAPEWRFEGSKYLLRTIGSIDIAAGLTMILPRVPRPALFWAVAWGFATATSRLYFLTRFAPPYGYFLVKPWVEFLVRIPNGTIPLILAGLLGYGGRRIASLNMSKVLGYALDAVLVAIVLDSLVEFTSQKFEVELLTKGLPLWYFSLGAIIGGLTLLYRLAMRGGLVGTRFVELSVLGAFVAYGMHEGFELFSLATRNSVRLALINFAEHMPIYLVFVLNSPTLWGMISRGGNALRDSMSAKSRTQAFA